MTESSTSYDTDGGGYTYEAVPAGYGAGAGHPLGGVEAVPEGYTNGYRTGSYGLDPSAYGGTPGSGTYGTDIGYGTLASTGYDTGYGSGGYGAPMGPTGYDTGYGTTTPTTTTTTTPTTTSAVPTTTTTPTTTTDPGSEADSGSTTGSASETSSKTGSETSSKTNSNTDPDSNFDSTGDYSSWTWKQVMAHVTGYDPDDTSVNGSLTSSPQSMQDAADALWYTGQVLKEAGDNLDAQTESLAGEHGSWRGPAAQSFYSVMKNLSQQVSNLTGVLTGGITGDNNVPQQLADNSQHLREAINKLMDIDNWYAQQAINYYNDHRGKFSDDIVMDNGQIAVSQVKAIPPMMDSDMRQVLITLAGHYKVTIDQVPKAAFSNPMTGSGGGLPSDPLSTSQNGLSTPLQPPGTPAASPYGGVTPGIVGGVTPAAMGGTTSEPMSGMSPYGSRLLPSPRACRCRVGSRSRGGCCRCPRACRCRVGSGSRGDCCR
ncbi:WXG100 family type VII secretion target [Streptomyces varsoviensis]|uniref:WXG100 family type VII secretion target n=1 Tax=Streptomyces varsoviensis TaxID=67373 RepID=UPI000AEB4F2D|nr:WXG100 family type VII secretion target [Streptomyces varsoviensis]